MRSKKENIDVNFLELTPVRNYDSVKEENGLSSVLIPRFTNKLLVRILNPMLKDPNVKVKLDEFGSAMWEKIDNNKKVDEICIMLQKEFGERIEPVHERVPKFLKQLYGYKIISFKELNRKD